MSICILLLLLLFFDPEGLPSKFLTRLPGVCSGGGQVIYAHISYMSICVYIYIYISMCVYVYISIYVIQYCNIILI